MSRDRHIYWHGTGEVEKLQDEAALNQGYGRRGKEEIRIALKIKRNVAHDQQRSLSLVPFLYHYTGDCSI